MTLPFHYFKWCLYTLYSLMPLSFTYFSDYRLDWTCHRNPKLNVPQTELLVFFISNLVVPSFIYLRKLISSFNHILKLKPWGLSWGLFLPYPCISRANMWTSLVLSPKYILTWPLVSTATAKTLVQATQLPTWMVMSVIGFKGSDSDHVYFLLSIMECFKWKGVTCLSWHGTWQRGAGFEAR